MRIYGLVALAAIPLAVLSTTSAHAQSIDDGPISLEVRLHEIDIPYEPTDLGAFGAGSQPDDFSFTVWARDMPDLDATDWSTSATCLGEQLSPPAVTSDYDTVLLSTSYDGRVVPSSVDLRFDGWEDESEDSLIGIACESERCTYETGFCCGITIGGICLGTAEDDDLRCNAIPFATGLDYRLGRACDTFDHGFVEGSCPAEANYRPRISTYWQYLDGDTLAEAHEMGTVDVGGDLLHRNGLRCYTDADPTVAGPDAFVQFDTAAAGTVTLSVCDETGGELTIEVDGPGGTTTLTDTCANPLEVEACTGAAWTVRVDSDRPSAFDVRVSLAAPAPGDARLCCGDAVVDPNEECDDAGESATCNADCSASLCGDGITNATSGELCDDGAQTATCDRDCTPAECGDGVRNATAGEACDEGVDNGLPLGCALDCSGLTPALCGNGVIETGEACDDAGESVNCDDDCSRVTCGDGVVNATAGETCDDGGASAACDIDCTPAACGDGVVNRAAGEICDDGASNGMPRMCAADCGGVTAPVCGNGVAETGEFCDTAGASATCDADCTDALCGDGVLNEAAGEVCDDGANNGEPLACANNCSGVTPSFCGNGVTEAGEECDARGFSPLCDGDCTEALCGDGTVNDLAGETCDDTNAIETDACLSSCLGASCGDGIIWDGVESCDDGADNGTPGSCALDCAGITPASCGNGVLEAGETCDTAGASESCDPDCTDAFCGDGFVNAAAGEACDDGPRNGDPFACNADCTATTAAVCGNGIAEAGERCDDGGESEACDADCSDAVCGDGTINTTAGEICDDRGLTEACDDDCTPSACGDGLFNPAAGERCDDGNASDEDGCLSTCQPARCGDGVVWAGVEFCDAGDRNGLPGECALDCAGITPSTCGNGTLEDGEFCDDGGTSASCDPDCTEAVCGDGFVNAPSGESCDDGPRNGSPLACNADCSDVTTGTCGNGVVEAGERCDDAGASLVCDADCTDAFCGDGTINEAAGETCDDGLANGDPLACNADCTGPTVAACGNGVVELGEECDDGDESAACDDDCTMAMCGDGTTNGAAGEACDDGNDLDTDACTTACVGATCGDGIVQTDVEACDDGLDNGTPGLCALDCAGVTPATCGNGTVEGDEACDDAGESDVCDPDCSDATCGDGYINATAGETCDDGERNGEPLACADDCSGITPAECGNGVVEIGEQCDDSGATDACDDDCSRPVCGDGVLNAAAGEVCDPGLDPTCLNDCSGQTAEPGEDAGTDAGDDAGVDAGDDAGTDAGADATDDAGIDSDAGDDTGTGDTSTGGDDENEQYNVTGGGGCATGGAGSGAWPLALLALVAIRRRR